MALHDQSDDMPILLTQARKAIVESRVKIAQSRVHTELIASRLLIQREMLARQRDELHSLSTL